MANVIKTHTLFPTLINEFRHTASESLSNAIQNEDLENNLTDTIEKNLISDTKVGIFLSGGIDSSIIAILSKKLDIKFLGT